MFIRNWIHCSRHTLEDVFEKIHCDLLLLYGRPTPRVERQYQRIAVIGSSQNHGVRHGFKIVGAKTIIELESEPKLILIYKFIKLSKILIHAFKY